MSATGTIKASASEKDLETASSTPVIPVPNDREETQESGATPVPDLDDEPPDGGLHAWLTVLCVFLLSFMAFGTGNVWGLFQDAYQTRPDSLFQDQGVFRLGFIGGCSVGLGFAVGPFSNILISKFGVHAPILLGVLMMSVALELASISGEYWELLLSQGIMFGLGASFSYIPSIGLVSQWFVKRRSLATGIASSGSSFGAVVLSPIIQAIINNVSIRWSLRILGLLCLVLGLAAVGMARHRVAAKGRAVQYHIFDLELFTIPGYPVFLAFAFLWFFGYITPSFFIPTYCTVIGISSANISGVVSVSMVSNAVGRVLAGHFADSLGSINVLMAFTFLTGVSCIIWLFATNLAIMMVFVVFWGFFGGCYWALAVPAVAKIVGLPKLGSALAILFLMNVVPPIFAAPIGSGIMSATESHLGVSGNSREVYGYLILFCGLSSIVASFILLPVRLRFSRQLVAKV